MNNILLISCLSIFCLYSAAIFAIYRITKVMALKIDISKELTKVLENSKEKLGTGALREITNVITKSTESYNDSRARRQEAQRRLNEAADKFEKNQLFSGAKVGIKSGSPYTQAVDEPILEKKKSNKRFRTTRVI